MNDPDEMPQAPTLLTASDVAILFRVKPKTVYAWIKAGKLTAIRTPLGGVRVASAQVAGLLNPSPKEESNTP